MNTNWLASQRNNIKQRILNRDWEKTKEPKVVPADGLNIDSAGMHRWYKNGELHRTDGPAGDSQTGIQVWCINGVKHRTDGPAVIKADGTVEYWVNDVQVDQLTVLLLQHQTQSAEAVL